MPQRKCRGNCVGGMLEELDAEIRKTIRNTLVFKSKQDTGISSAEVFHKLRAWHAKQEACLSATRWRDVWKRGLRGRPENYINQWRFRPMQNEAERQGGFTENPHSHPFQTFTYSNHTYILGLKRNEKITRLYFYTSALMLFFTVCNNSLHLLSTHQKLVASSKQAFNIL